MATKYNKDAVEKELEKAKVPKGKRSLTHALLKGREKEKPNKEETEDREPTLAERYAEYLSNLNKNMKRNTLL